MSSARNDFCESASRPPFGCSLPRRYGRRGCMPLPVKSVVGSFCGTSEAEGIIACGRIGGAFPPEADPPWAEKNSRYFVRISLMFIPLKVTRFLQKRKRRHDWCGASSSRMAMSGTGSRYENEHENGLAHFLEHMFFKGTKKRPSARAISEELDTIGSVYNAFTSKERTAYYAKVASRYLEPALDVISDIFLNSTLPQKEIKKERGAIIQEIDMYEDMPMRTVDSVFDALMFGREHPLGRPILGPKENIMRF